MATESVTDRLRAGLCVEDHDGVAVGRIVEVWADVGASEAWGSAGSRLVDGAEANDPEEFAWSEAMPGEGESYFRLERTGGGDLYVPISYVSTVNGDAVILSVDADDVTAMRWDLRPDFLHENKQRPGPSEGSN
jgi:hypothetical protein